MLAVHEIGYGNQPVPMTVLGSIPAFGQVHHAAGDVTKEEVREALDRRGYKDVATRPVVHHVPPAPTLTRQGAIRIGIDEAIDGLNRRGYTIPTNTATHPRRCNDPTGFCYLPSTTWSALVNYATGLANYYLAPGVSLPAWVLPEHMAGLYGYLGQDAIPIPMPTLPGEEPGLFQRNPWLSGMIGGIFTGLGSFFTAKMLADDLKKVLPTGLSDADKLELRQYMLSLAPAGTENTVGAAVDAATTPSWLIPVMIGGVIFLILIMMMKK